MLSSWQATIYNSLYIRAFLFIWTFYILIDLLAPSFLCRPASDIAISGLGWIAVEPLGVPSSDPDSSVEEEDGDSGELHLRVHVPKPVEVFVRAPLPVGKAASQWYRYQELTEVEEELRPKWHYWCCGCQMPIFGLLCMLLEQLRVIQLRPDIMFLGWSYRDEFIVLA